LVAQDTCFIDARKPTERATNDMSHLGLLSFPGTGHLNPLAAMFGAVPLAIGGGDGSEIRQPLGITIIGGLIVSQLLTLYTTPVIYLYLDRLRRKSNDSLETTETAPVAA
jgi:hypothetical protein